MSKQLADVIEQQQQHANTFDMKFVRLADQDEAVTVLSVMTTNIDPVRTI
jgi:hypothetical protein